LKTAEEQSLQRADDPTIATVCKTEGRCLITADIGFAQICFSKDGSCLGNVRRETDTGMYSVH